MPINVIDKGHFVSVAVDDDARALIKPGDTVMVLGLIGEDGGDVVRVRFGDSRVGQHLWVPRITIATLQPHDVIERFFHRLR